MLVRKRTNELQEFQGEKIYNAIIAAMKSVDENNSSGISVAKRIVKEIKAENKDKDVITVEEIQNAVEEKLMGSHFKKTARSYIRYRYDREMIRNDKTKLMTEIGEKLRATNVENQNANVDERSFGGRVGEASRVITKQYALDNCMSIMAKTNHLNNEIYIHDLDSYAIGNHNCLTLPMDDLLANGFNTRQVDIRPAGSVNTAFQLVAVLFQIQSLQQFGGVSASHIDWTMVPYVRKSFYKHYCDGMKYFCDYDWNLNNYLEDSDTYKKIIDIPINDYSAYLNEADDVGDFDKVYKYALDMTTKEVHQAVEGMYHNLNSLQSRSGNQLPFSSINYGTCTLPEGRMVTKAILDVSIEGLGALHRTSIFPCGIFQYMKGVNDKPGTPNYDLYRLALESTAKRLYPNYCNVDWSTNAGYDRDDPRTYVSTMGCRTYNGADINAEPGTNPQMKDGRGNICPVTIILPTLAMEAGRNVEKFMELLDVKINEAKDMLIERFEWICSQPMESAKFMYENNTMLGYHPEEGIRSALKHGTLAVGQLGLAETLQLLIGKDQTTEEGMKLAKRIEQLFKDRCAEFKQQYKLNFGVYFTPAENLCYTAMKNFKKKYGIIENVSDKDFFTNSIHVPVWYKMSPFDKIDIESQLTGYSNAGCITYVELEYSALHNIDALEKLVNYAMDKDVPYLAINVPNDTCLDCGFTGEFNDECPVCKSKNIQQLRRVTGYLTGNYKTAFNQGKQEEVEKRAHHNGKEL